MRRETRASSADPGGHEAALRRSARTTRPKTQNPRFGAPSESSSPVCSGHGSPSVPAGATESFHLKNTNPRNRSARRWAIRPDSASAIRFDCPRSETRNALASPPVDQPNSVIHSRERSCQRFITTRASSASVKRPCTLCEYG